jgi:hypothetical protein
LREIRILDGCASPVPRFAIEVIVGVFGENTGFQILLTWLMGEKYYRTRIWVFHLDESPRSLALELVGWLAFGEEVGRLSGRRWMSRV